MQVPGQSSRSSGVSVVVVVTGVVVGGAVGRVGGAGRWGGGTVPTRCGAEGRDEPPPPPVSMLVSMGARSGMREDTVSAVLWEPLAAPISVGATLSRSCVRSGPAGRCGCGRGGGGGRCCCGGGCGGGTSLRSRP